MKSFLKNSILQSIIALGICVVLAILTYSIKGDFYPYYEQDEVIERAAYFKQIEEEVNTVFIGSSRIFRHIDPLLFDSLVVGSNSYNMGYAGLFPFRSYDYLEHLALESANSIQHVFIELSPIAILGKNYNTDPFVYSINLDQYLKVVNYCLKSPYNLSLKLKYIGGYSLLMAYKYTGIGSSKYLNHYLWGPSVEEVQAVNKPETYHQGFLSLDEDFAMKGNNYSDLKQRKEGFDAHFKEELAMYNLAYDQFISTDFKPINDSFTDYVMEKALQLTRQGKQVHFIISPRQEFGDLYYVKSQKAILQDFTTFDFSDPHKYPTLYLKGNSFDRVHLNESGARLLTTELAKQANEKAIF